jgi:hypothetical protein
MTMPRSDEIWKRVEENRLSEERLREPYLAAFRSTPEEIDLRKIEDAHEQASGESEFGRFAERLARAGREGVRFERYLVRQGFYPGIPMDDPLGIARKDR